MKLAFWSSQHGLCLFVIKPKLHYMAHVALDLRDAAKKGVGALNPALHACPADEDFVGKLSRICRVVHPLVAPLRCIQRYLSLVPGFGLAVTMSEHVSV